MLFKLLTKNYTRVPLFWVDFDLRKYQKFGEKGSCNMLNIKREKILFSHVLICGTKD